MNGVIETATGDLLRAAPAPYDFAADGSLDAATESVRTDVPEPAFRRGDRLATQMHRWTGTEWALVAQPFHAGLRFYQQQAMQTATVSEDGAEATTYDWFHRAEDRSLRVNLDIQQGSVGVRFDGDVADRATLTPTASDAIIDTSDLVEGRRSISLFARATPTQFDLFEAWVGREL